MTTRNSSILAIVLDNGDPQATRRSRDGALADGALEVLSLAPDARQLLTPAQLADPQCRYANAEFLLFLQAGDVPLPGCMRAHLATLRDPSVDVSSGAIVFEGSVPVSLRAMQRASLTARIGAHYMIRRTSFNEELGQAVLDELCGDCGGVALAASFAGRERTVVETPTATLRRDAHGRDGFFASLGRAFARGRSEARLIAAHPAQTYLDMPSPLLVTVAVALAALVSAASLPGESILAALALPVTLLLLFGAGALEHRNDRLAGALGQVLFLAFDAGRLWQGLCCAQPSIALRRLRRSSDQVTREWSRILATGWALWLALLIDSVVAWFLAR